MNKAHASVMRKGREARLANHPRKSCPYNINALGGKFGNIPTGERGFARAWYKGWDEADKESR